jgi:hypothetical protein
MSDIPTAADLQDLGYPAGEAMQTMLVQFLNLS